MITCEEYRRISKSCVFSRADIKECRPFLAAPSVERAGLGFAPAPHRHITAIANEAGVVRHPFVRDIKNATYIAVP